VQAGILAAQQQQRPIQLPPNPNKIPTYAG